MHRFAPEFRRLALACLFAWSLLPVVAAAADLPPGVFDFEAGRGPRPDQWLGPEGSVSVDSTVVHGGQRSARIQRTATSEGSFSALNFRVPADLPMDGPDDPLELPVSVVPLGVPYVQPFDGTSTAFGVSPTKGRVPASPS